MTMLPFDGSTPGTRQAVHEGLSRRELRDGLAALLRRRVPRGEVADLVQSVLCDALASERAPSDPDELARWVTGIARHKVADYHRRAGRLVLDDGSIADATSEPPAPFEARQILGGVLSDDATTRDRETLDWMIREHGGEPLCAIAEEEGIPSPAVRQRVSRLRRLLRSRFGWAAALALLVASTAGTRAVLTPDSTDIAPERGSAVGGTWHVASYTAPEGLPKATAAWLAWLARDATVRVGDGKVVVAGPGGALERSIRGVTTRGDRTTAELVDPSTGRVLQVIAEGSGRSLRVTLSEGGQRGTITLERR